ncbi:MAG: LPS export ABC transporter permease LptG [Anaerolineae bacterium]
MRILDRYIASNYLKGLLPVMVLLLALFSLVALADELEQVGKGSFRQVDAFLVILYTAPRRMVDLLPVTALLGGLMGLGAMANHQELIAARSSGLSKAHMAWPVFKAVLLVAALAMMMQSILVPASERAASEVRSKSLEQTTLEDGGRLQFWTRSRENFVHVNDVLFNRILQGVEIYTTGQNGELRQIIQARQATIVGQDTWLLDGVTQTRLEGMTAIEEQIDRLSWTGLLSEEQANILILPLEALAPVDLVRYILYLRANGLDTHHFQVIFWQQISSIIAILAMGLLSLPMLVGSTRGISAGQRIMTGGIIGIVFYLLQQLTGHLAGLFNLIPSLTILTPVIILLAISILAQFWRSGSMRKPWRPSPVSVPR